MSDHSGITWLHIPRLASLAMAAAMALAGCVPHSTDLQSKSEPDVQICRPSPALLVPPSAPDCVFKRTALRTIDPRQFARLKVEYEIQCYQTAERTVRERLRLLQAANRCQMASAH